jgi:hypothetical protein
MNFHMRTSNIWFSILLVGVLSMGSVYLLRHYQAWSEVLSRLNEVIRVTSTSQPHTILLNANVAVVSVNSGQAQITATFRDEQGWPVSNAAVQFVSQQGSLSPASATTDAHGVATSTFTAGATPGQAIVTVACCGLTQSILLEIREPQSLVSQNQIEINVADLTLAPGQQTEVTVRLLGLAGRPLAGELVTFFGSLGEVAPASALTDENGRAISTFTAKNEAGQATITVLFGYTSASATIQTSTPILSKNFVLFLPVVSR